MGKEGVFQSTILGEGPIYESKRVLEPASTYTAPENRFGQKIATTTTTTTTTGNIPRSSSYEKFKQNFKG